jgi:hypothetical protein
MPTILDALQFLIENGPGRTEAELARAIFGRDAYQQRVNGDCRLLENRGLVERRGTGGPGDPFTYFPKDSDA